MEKNKYPIYIVSKGRFENPITAKYFKNLGFDFLIAVEPQEYDNYCKSLGKEFVLKLPFSNLGLGSYPARNYCWEHSIENGHERHFVFDDNIYGFVRLNNGKRVSIKDREGALIALKTLETFSERFSNIAISGYNYRYFVTQTTSKPFFINTHVYSAMLINNKIPFRWRMKYNEDVDLCLQALHNKWCTVLLNVFLVNKVSTVAKLKGGNQTELYQNNAFDKKVLKSKSLEMVWPKYVKTVIRFNRPHHFIDWKSLFKHPLIKVVD